MVRGIFLRLAFSLVWLSAAALSVPAHAADGTADSAYNQARMHQPYAEGGEQTCLKCHNTAPVNLILQTPMAVKGDLRSPFGQEGCESCHGPSGEHAKLKFIDGKLVLPPVLFVKPKIDGVPASPVEARNKACLTCHQGDQLINWQGSQMQAAGVGCSDCHTAHAAKDPVLVRTSQPEVCFRCHAQQRAESFEYSHHPIREGKVVCSDCHNPMGSAGPHLLKEFTVNETCYNCHADKRGPMLWEHQPVRENCLNCHTPHGSNQPRLLVEQLNFLCSSCHSAESNNSGGAFGGNASVPFHSMQGSVFANSALANQRQCVNCHSQVHGSNSPSGAYFFR